jgi:hypothetical protein
MAAGGSLRRSKEGNEKSDGGVFIAAPGLFVDVKLIVGIRGGAVKKRVFRAVVKNTYLTRRPPTPVSARVYRGFV